MIAFQYRLYPTPPQERQLLKMLDACRFVFNWGLEQRKLAWEQNKKTLNYNVQQNMLPVLKTEHSWLKNVYSHLLQDALMRLDRAFKAFFRRVKAGQKPGYPRFKGRDFYDSITFPACGTGGAFLEKKRLRLNRIGRVRIRLHRPLEGKVKTCTVKRKADGWYASFACEIERNIKPSVVVNPIGVDLGLKEYAVLSSGEKIANPRHLRKAEKRIKTAQRLVSRKKRGSKRRGKARAILAKKWLRLSRARKDWQFKLAHDLVRRFNPVFVEDLEVKKLQEKPGKGKQARGLRRSVADVAWGQFLGILEHKAEQAGVRVVRVPPRGTTQECSRCHRVVPKTLKDRTHRCLHCGLVLDRDINAAINILDRGRAGPSGRVA